MELTEVERATLSLALSALESDPDATLPTAAINNILGLEWKGRIAEQRSVYVDANKASMSNAALLSSGAQDYWNEARRVLAYGRLVLSMGSRKAEKTLSRKCEALDESFPARVPDREKSMFLISRHVFTLDPDDYDDRWAWTIDGEFPLLRREFLTGCTVVANPLREAQMDILAEVLAPATAIAPPTASSSSGSQLRDLVRRLEQ